MQNSIKLTWLCNIDNIITKIKLLSLNHSPQIISRFDAMHCRIIQYFSPKYNTSDGKSFKTLR